ncbi:glycine zipper 2TM domain-containing protein [Lysobacter sp. A03]|uniref:glycine zipper 2TM domain-containing protein n=1 Tax=Lysobacter sp. A03 TaxID=1199154 RepID=UPI0005B720ED|nr:glycine zipper 2TM domain-containing protein [Lysobacter sp. A03]KIQ98417.1 putative exported protein [Lysobacter sp. A03]
MNKNMLAVAVAALMVGGVAVAAYNSFDRPASHDVEASIFSPVAGQTGMASFAGDSRADGSIAMLDQAPMARLDYADVIDIDEVTAKEDLYAVVTGVDPVRETSTVSSPRQVCDDVVVQERLPERDGNVGGTVAGAVIGGVLGNQVGKGSGRRAATAAGAVAGGFVGNRVDRNHVGGRVVERVDRQCRTVSDTSQSSRVVGYDVSFRNPDGTTGSKRMGSKPGDRISLGSRDEVVGYDVTYRFEGQERTVRMNDRPGDRLPVIDGEVVVQTASVAGTPRG